MKTPLFASLSRRSRWLMVAILVAAGLAGCKQVENPNQDSRNRESWLFFNYSIRAPSATEVAVRAVPKQKNDRFIGQQLRLMVWQHFIPNSVMEAFSEATGASIQLDSYESNTELQERLQSGANADVIMPASFMVQELRTAGLLASFDHTLIPNIRNIDDQYDHPAFDPELNDCVPYLWTTVGIAYNYDQLDDLPQVWGDLLLPPEKSVPLLKGRLALLPVPQRAYGAALIHLGYSIDTENKDEIRAAAKLVKDQNDILRFKFGRSTTVEGLATGELIMAQAYSNEAAQAQMRNRSVRFCVPEDGSWISFFCLAIPKNTSEKQRILAQAFIDFLLQPTVAADVVNYSLCASTIAKTQSYVRADVRLGPTYMLPSDPTKRYLQIYTPAVDDLRNQLWQQLTAGMPMENTR